jgi:hypothetical protein
MGVNSSEDARHCSVLYICKYCTLWKKYIYVYYMKSNRKCDISYLLCHHVGHMRVLEKIVLLLTIL